jgi:hypothetical protein
MCRPWARMSTLVPAVVVAQGQLAVAVDASMEDQLGSPWPISVMGPMMAVSILAEWRGGDLRDPVRHRVIHDRLKVEQILRLLLGQPTH